MTDKTELNDELRPEYDETLLKNGIVGNMRSNMPLEQTLSDLNQMLLSLFPPKKLLMKPYDPY